MSPMMIKLRFLHASSGRPSFCLPRFPKIKTVGICVTVDAHVIDALRVRSGSDERT